MEKRNYEILGYEYRCVLNGEEVMRTKDCGLFLIHSAMLLGNKVVAFQRREVRSYEQEPNIRTTPWENYRAEDILAALER